MTIQTIIYRFFFFFFTNYFYHLITYTFFLHSFSILFNNFQKGSETKNASPEVNLSRLTNATNYLGVEDDDRSERCFYMCVFENEGGIIGAEGKRRRDRHVKRAHTHRDLDFFACRTKQRFIQNKEGREKKKKGMKKKKR